MQNIGVWKQVFEPNKKRSFISMYLTFSYPSSLYTCYTWV